MKQSELNHLRMLLGWVRCEIGQDPEEMVAMLREMAPKLGPLEDPEGAKQRLVEGHDKARSVPKYVRAAVKALAKLTGPGAEVEDAAPHPRDIPTLEQMRELLGTNRTEKIPVLKDCSP